jgi:hypothetical protein
MTHTVVYFTDTTGFGGAEQALLILMAGLNRDRWQPVLMYHSSPGVAPLLDSAARQDVELWPVARLHDGHEGASRVFALARKLHARHPVVFHAHLTWPLACKFGLVGAIMARVPAVVATVHLFLEFPVNSSILIQQRLIAGQVGRYIAVSQHVAQRSIEELPWPPSKVQVIHNAVTLKPVVGRSALVVDGPRIRSDRPIVLTVARWMSRRDIGICWRLLPRCQRRSLSWWVMGHCAHHLKRRALAWSGGARQVPGIPCRHSRSTRGVRCVCPAVAV